ARDIGEGIHAVASDVAAGGGEDHAERAPSAFVLRKRQDRRYRLALVERGEQVDDRPPAGGGPALRQLPYLEPIDLARGGEEQDRIVSGGDEHLLHRVLFLRRHPGAALATTVLGAERRERGALDVAVERDRHDHLVAFDQVLVLDAVPGGGDLADARGRILVADFDQLLAHHFVEPAAVGEDREVFLDLHREFLEFVADLVAPQRGQAVQAQLEDRPYLRVGQAVEAFCRPEIGFHRFDQRQVRGDLSGRPFLRKQL